MAESKNRTLVDIDLEASHLMVRLSEMNMQKRLLKNEITLKTKKITELEDRILELNSEIGREFPNANELRRQREYSEQLRPVS